MKVYFVSVYAFLLFLQANGSMIDFSKVGRYALRSPSGEQEEPRPDRIPRHVVDEFSTYIDGLMSDNPVLSLEEDSEIAREARRELASIIEAVQDEREENDPSKLKPGQNPGIECGEFGCCSDNSKADSSGKKGCARKLCEDMYKNTCGSFTPKQKERECSDPIIKGYCPFTCGTCDQMPVPPITRCKQRNPSKTCCWNGTVKGKGPCPKCHDKYNTVCAMFYRIGKKSCASNSWKIRTFLENFCPGTCGICPE